MTLPNLFLLALALAMDAFAVAITTGTQQRCAPTGPALRLAFHFGLFQAAMPVIGWFVGLRLRAYIEQWDHWIAFALLAFVAIKMIRESLQGDTQQDNTKKNQDPTRGSSLLILSVATSIDALAVGISLSMLGLSIWMPALVIGLVCFALTAIGVYIGCKAARLGKLGQHAGLIGGLVLLGIGLHILWEHKAFSFIS